MEQNSFDHINVNIQYGAEYKCTISYTLLKNITIQLNTSLDYIGNCNNFMTFLLDFVNLISNHKVIGFNSQNIPLKVAELFLSICKRNNPNILVQIDTESTLMPNLLTPLPLSNPIARPSHLHDVPTYNMFLFDNEQPNIDENKINLASLTNSSNNLFNMVQNIFNRSEITVPNIPETHQKTSETSEDFKREVIIEDSDEEIKSHMITTGDDNSSRIQKIVNEVKVAIEQKKIRPPDFTIRTVKNYNKIKNFIYNFSKVWLSTEDINLFIFMYGV